MSTTRRPTIEIDKLVHEHSPTLNFVLRNTAWPAVIPRRTQVATEYIKLCGLDNQSAIHRLNEGGKPNAARECPVVLSPRAPARLVIGDGRTSEAPCEFINGPSVSVIGSDIEPMEGMHHPFRFIAIGVDTAFAIEKSGQVVKIVSHSTYKYNTSEELLT